MSFSNLLNKNIKVTQIKSGLKFNAKQVSTLIGLGLRGIGTSSEFVVDDSLLGMIKKVSHIIKISYK